MKNKKIILVGTLALALSVNFVFAEKSFAASDISNDINKKEEFDKTSQMKNLENAQQKELVKEFDQVLEKEKNSTNENLEDKKNELSKLEEENKKIEDQNQQIDNNISNIQNEITKKEEKIKELEGSDQNKSYQESKKSYEKQSQIYKDINEEKDKKKNEINDNNKSISEEEKNVENIKETQKENQEKLNESQKKVEIAKNNLENAQKAYDDYLSKKDSDPKKSEEYKNLVKAKEDLKNAEADLLSLKEDKKSTEDKINSINKEVKKEKADIKNIDENIEKNEKALDKKIAEKRRIENLKKQYNNDLKTAKNNEEKAKKNLDSIDMNQRKKDYDKAKKLLDEAKSRLNEIDKLKKDGAFAFYEWIRKNPKNDEELQDAKKALEALNAFTDNVQRGNPKDATAIENIKKSIGFLKKQNSLRAKDENFPESRNPYKTNHLIMAIAMSNADNSYDFSKGHLDNFGVGENLSWGNIDPFDGWYYEEKVIYNAILKKSKELIEKDNLDEYAAWEKAMKLLGVNPMSIGHYINVMSAYKISGIGYAYYGGFGSVSSASYSWNGTNLMSIEEYEERFNEFLQSLDKEKAKKEYQQRLNEFNKAKELLNNNDYENAKKAYDNAKKSLEDIQKKINDNNLEEEKVNKNIDQINKAISEQKEIKQAYQEKLNVYIKNSGLENYQKDLKLLEKNIEKKNSEKKLLADKVEKAQKEFDALIADDTADKLKMEIKKAQNNLDDKEREEKSNKIILENTDNKLKYANEKLENLKKERNVLKEEINEISERLIKEKDKLNLAKKDLDEKTLENHEFLEANKDLNELKNNLKIEKENYNKLLNIFSLNNEKIGKLSSKIDDLEEKSMYLASLDFYKLHENKTDRKDLLYLNDYVDKYDRLAKKIVNDKEIVVGEIKTNNNIKKMGFVNNEVNENANTGVSSLTGILSLLNISTLALFKSRKRK